MFFDLPSIRQQFPLLDQKVDGHPLVYLDSAATAQKPKAVLEAMTRYYEQDNANVHRGMHVLAERATEAFEGARKTVQRFLNAQRPEEIIFVKNATEAINLVAISLSRGRMLKKNDAVLLTRLEHHSNIVPWLQLKEHTGIDVLWADIEEDGAIAIDDLRSHLKGGRVKLVAITAQSNVLGVRPPLKEIITLAHEVGALVLVDAAQSIVHGSTDVQDLDCDFLAFSGHKLYGPTGIGVLYGKRALLQEMPPFLGGGMMIGEVRDDSFTAADLPQKFEAGTQPIVEAIGLQAAIDWLGQYSWEDIQAHETSLVKAATESLRSVPHLTILGSGSHATGSGSSAELYSGTNSNSMTSPNPHSGCLSFTIPHIHPHDLTDLLGRKGICLRAGHHCAQPLHRRLGVTASTRLSFGIYTTKEEVMTAAAEIASASRLFAYSSTALHR